MLTVTLMYDCSACQTKIISIARLRCLKVIGLLWFQQCNFRRFFRSSIANVRLCRLLYSVDS